MELELLELGNRTMIGIMGFKSDTPVLDVHCEIAYTHTGGLPIGISELCHAVRRATAISPARTKATGRVRSPKNISVPPIISIMLARPRSDISGTPGRASAAGNPKNFWLPCATKRNATTIRRAL